MKKSWWDFHTQGDEGCEACAIPPTSHNWEDCDGFIHTQFDTELDSTEAKCDQCNVLLPTIDVR